MLGLRRKVALLGSVGAVVGLVLLVSPAGAHPSFDLGSVPANSNQRLQLRLPPEGMARSTTNVRVALGVPRAFTVVECLPPAGWDCGVFDEGSAGTSVVWEADTPVPAELFDVLVRTPAATGTYAMPVEQRLSDRTEVSWSTGPEGTHPAPALTVSAPRTAPAPNTDVPEPHAPTTTTTVDPRTSTSTTTGPGGPVGGGPGPGVTTGPFRPAPPTTAGPAAPSTEPTLPGDVPASIPEDAGAFDVRTDPGPSPMRLTPARILVGAAALVGAAGLALLVRGASRPPDAPA